MNRSLNPPLQWQPAVESYGDFIATRGRKLTLRAMLMVVAVWLSTIVLHEIDVGGAWLSLENSTWLLIGVWLTCFAGSFWLSLSHYRASGLAPVAPPPDTWWSKWVIVYSLVAAVGAALVIYDFAILRGYGFATSVVAIRAEEGTAMLKGFKQGSPISGLGRLMIPAMMIAFMMAASGWKRLDGRARFTLVASSLLTLSEQMLFEGGRFFITALFVVVIVCYFLKPPAHTGPSGRNLPIKRIALAVVILMSFFAYVFVDRILDRGDFFWSAYLGLSKDYDIYVDPETVNRFEGPFGGLWFSVCMLWLYATQGFNELDNLLSVHYFNHAYGLYQVPHASNIAALVFGVDLYYDLMANLPNVGTYYTFYGANYIDFGNVGALLSAIVLGFFTARGVLGFTYGRWDTFSLIGPMFLVICFFTPAVSLVTNLWPAMFWAVLAGTGARAFAART
jgi:oligosaccharide repeat unit polymerase